MSEEKDDINQELTTKQKQFCEEYLLDLNITQAAIRAGYAQNSASEQGSRLIGKANAQKYIEELKKRRAERTNINQDWVIQQLKDFYTTSSKRVAKMIYNPESKQYEQAEDQFGDPVYTVVDALGTSKSIEMMMKHTGSFEKNNNQKQPISQIIITKRVIGKRDKGD